MGMFDTALSVLDAPSNALQGLAVGGPEGMWRGLTQQENYDFEQLLSDEFRKENPELSYWGSGVANFIVDPLNLIGTGLLSKAFTKGAKTAKGAMSPMGTITDRALLAEMPNRLETLGHTFYQGGIPGQVLETGLGAVKGGLKSLNREFNPFMVKAQKFFKQAGIPTTTRKVAKEVLDQFNDPQVVAELKRIDSIPANARNAAERQFLEDMTTAGKVLQGQLGWNLLEKQAYGLPKRLSKYKATHFYNSPTAFSADEFIKGNKAYSRIANKKNIGTSTDFLTDDVLEQVFGQIQKSQKIKNTGKTTMVFKKDTVGNANATKLAVEASQKAGLKNAVVKVFQNKGRGFNKIDDLVKELDNAKIKRTKHDWKGNKSQVDVQGIPHRVIKDKNGREFVMINESFRSGDNLLGGVQQITLVDSRGKMFSFIADKQDLLGVGFPGGVTPVVVTPAMPTHALGKTFKKVAGEGMPTKGLNLGGTSKNPSISPMLKESAEEVLESYAKVATTPRDYVDLIGKYGLVTQPLQTDDYANVSTSSQE